MNEGELGALMHFQPFRSVDGTEMDGQLRRCTSLSGALWGRTTEDLERQLATPYPEIPSGFLLTDFRELLNLSIRIGSMDWNDPRNTALRPFLNNAALRWFLTPSSVVRVNAQSFTTWKARCEIVRRAIEFLETH
jgi:hypothetical protein